MSMPKYAYILKTETLKPDNYFAEVESDGFFTKILAVDSFDVAIDLAKKLADEGYNFIDLCADFTDELAGKIKVAAGPTVKVSLEKLDEKQAAKWDDNFEYRHYGIIVMHSSYDMNKHNAFITSTELDTTLYCVGDMDEACKAMNQMLSDDVQFAALCCAFDEEKFNTLINETNCPIPVEHCMA